MLSQMDTEVSLVVKVLWKLISRIYFRVYLEVCVHKNPTCFSRWSVRYALKESYLKKANISKKVETIDLQKFENKHTKTGKTILSEVSNLSYNYTNNNYTNKNYTDINYNNPIYLISKSDTNDDKIDRRNETSMYISIIKENIAYDAFMQDKTYRY